MATAQDAQVSGTTDLSNTLSTLGAYLQSDPAPPDQPYSVDDLLETATKDNIQLRCENNEQGIYIHELRDQLASLRENIENELQDQLASLKEKIETLRNQRNKAEIKLAELETYTHFATFPLEDGTLGNLEEASRKLKHAMLTDGMTAHETIEHLRRQLMCLPEVNALGGFIDFLTHH